ncbi:glycerophosphodiester phosphodiesterase family protein [Achromobacter xylosoxidans]|uniref:Glycerophosphodiester phosphodiesterase n=1 Tax=Alcaligenes xylosoxydans xylosoxydans TaxID=85698 RepID=A0A424WH67_ALCXX|nr:glycerophosphodiester phosphodiesterase family protein [Achromobacter xylosoxidans]MBC9904337.1 glycerophosphodiester phosphodiesterase [Achromobacter xylosoxidans]MBD0868952.1 glycerophosphodiester phosphodiesterase [Achromobacter xylosoxidans]QNP88715.1 glycerophosphodiester phosphodiesterase [Achromobacter xylosoxidans]RPJ92590.1 glycerophosphodiester phosphodiesterase [Achromobacter xylosoxidans]
MRKRRVAALAAIALPGFIYVNNADWSASDPGARATLLAHRGIAQRYDTAGMERDTCTASRIVEPTHGYLENTIASMRASFEAGADIVEIDVHPTTDGQFAVFHDWTVDCRTEGRGATREHTMAELKALDIGYGYTADGGKTFPFRGRGVGLMPTLSEVLQAFPRQRFLINVKSRDAEEGAALAAVLNGLPPARRADFMVYGGEEPVGRLRELAPGVRTLTRADLKSCLLGYAAAGWTGHVPQVCRGMALTVPVNVAPWLWGWPGRFLDRMEAAGSSVFLLGPYAGDGHSTGIDTPEDIRRVPAGYAGGIWTNEIEAVARAFKRGP